MSKRDEDRKKKEKKQQNWLEAQILAILQKSLKTALDQAMDDLFKGW